MAQKLLHNIDVAASHGPLMLFAAVLLVLGMNLLAIGLLGEMQVRHYHSPLRRAPYSVDRILRTESEESPISE
jgi:glycerol-3-phosphate O-acyltransferase